MAQTMNRFILILLIPLVTACLGPVKELYPENPEQRNLPVYLLRYSWHVGVVIEAGHMRESLPSDQRFPQAKYLEFGWGDHRYYPHPDPGFGLMLSAGLLPTKSVIHVVGMHVPPQSYFPNSDVIQIMVNKDGMERLAEFISSRFRRDPKGSLQFAADGLYPNSVFYKATGLYYFPKTSNTWTARALRKTGAPITPFFAITSGNIIYQASQFGEVIQKR
ncbi:MAG: DUF2459 domain-containing protein [Balneolaceae bacterium]